MKSIIIKLFIENWQRKLISLVLAAVIWLMINHSIVQ
jgi:YbbR domain-containing protein